MSRRLAFILGAVIAGTCVYKYHSSVKTAVDCSEPYVTRAIDNSKPILKSAVDYSKPYVNAVKDKISRAIDDSLTNTPKSSVLENEVRVIPPETNTSTNPNPKSSGNLFTMLFSIEPIAPERKIGPSNYRGLIWPYEKKNPDGSFTDEYIRWEIETHRNR